MNAEVRIHARVVLGRAYVSGSLVDRFLLDLDHKRSCIRIEVEALTYPSGISSKTRYCGDAPGTKPPRLLATSVILID